MASILWGTYTATLLYCNHAPARIMQAVGEDLRGLVGAVEVGVVFGDGVRRHAGVRVYIHSQDCPCEVTAGGNIIIQFSGHHHTICAQREPQGTAWYTGSTKNLMRNMRTTCHKDRTEGAEH